MKNLFLLFIGILTFSNCTFTFNDDMYVSDSASGILDYKQETTKILIIHGMGTARECYAEPMIKGLVKELGLKKKPIQSKRVKLTNRQASSVLIEEFHVKKKNTNVLKKVQTFTVHWSAINAPIKKTIYLNDTDERRAKTPHNVKYKLFVDGLTDVAYYLNIPSQRKAIDETVLETLRLMVAQNPFGNSESSLGYCSPKELQKLHLISSSFGSTIVLNALNTIQTVGCGNPKVDNLLSAVNITFYMLSNQLPLLNLSESSKFGSFTLFETLENFVEQGNQADVISFNDPNDILGFRLPLELLPPDYSIDAVNVSVRNAKFYPLWKIDKPHWDAMKNPRIHEFIAQGIEKTNKTKNIDGEEFAIGTLRKSIFFPWRFSKKNADSIKPLKPCN